MVKIFIVGIGGYDGNFGVVRVFYYGWIRFFGFFYVV